MELSHMCATISVALKGVGKREVGADRPHYHANCAVLGIVMFCTRYEKIRIKGATALIKKLARLGD